MPAGDYTLCGHRGRHQFFGRQRTRERGARGPSLKGEANGDDPPSFSFPVISCSLDTLFPRSLRFMQTQTGSGRLGPLPVWLLDSAGNPA
jgi:hypothetical protein